MSILSDILDIMNQSIKGINMTDIQFGQPDQDRSEPTPPIVSGFPQPNEGNAAMAAFEEKRLAGEQAAAVAAATSAVTTQNQAAVMSPDTLRDNLANLPGIAPAVPSEAPPALGTITQPTAEVAAAAPVTPAAPPMQPYHEAPQSTAPETGSNIAPAEEAGQYAEMKDLLERNQEAARKVAEIQANAANAILAVYARERDAEDTAA